MTNISLCMITKNEADWIKRSISSVKKFVNEIIVVDTGSTDNTVSIALQEGANVYSYKSEKFSFSEARNFSLKKASCPWILVLDADEEIDSNDFPIIKETICKCTNNIGGIILRKYNYFGDGSWSSYGNTRIIRNFKGISFDKEIHETVNYSIDRLNLDYATCNAIIHHYGLAKENVNSKKHDFYKQLLLNFILINPDDAASYCYLAVEYANIGDFWGAEEACKKAIDVDKYNGKGYLFYSYVLMLQGKYNNAVDYLNKCMEFYENYQLNDIFVLNALGICKYEMGDYKESTSIFKSIIERGCNEPHIKLNYIASLAEQGENEKLLYHLKDVISMYPFLLSDRIYFESNVPKFAKSLVQYGDGRSLLKKFNLNNQVAPAIALHTNVCLMK